MKDPELRRENHRNLCRGEAWNAMTRQVFSFNRAITRENNVEEQERLALSLLLVQNMIVVWNVPHMSRVVAQLKRQGYQFDPADFKHMTPLLTSHIRMIPDFILKVDQGQNMSEMIAQPNLGRGTKPLDYRYVGQRKKFGMAQNPGKLE